MIVGGFLLPALGLATDRYLIDSTAPEIGWPLTITATVLLLVLIVWGRRLAARSADRLPFIGREPDSRDWNSRR